MLHSRLSQDPKAVARASFAIRSRSTREKPLTLDSTNVEAVFGQRFPEPQEQLARLIQVLKTRAEGAHLVPIPLGDLSHLSAAVGAPDERAVHSLLDWAV